MTAVLLIDDPEQAPAVKPKTPEKPRAVAERVDRAERRKRMDAALKAFVDANDAALTELAAR